MFEQILTTFILQLFLLCVSGEYKSACITINFFVYLTVFTYTCTIFLKIEELGTIRPYEGHVLIGLQRDKMVVCVCVKYLVDRQGRWGLLLKIQIVQTY